LIIPTLPSSYRHQAAFPGEGHKKKRGKVIFPFPPISRRLPAGLSRGRVRYGSGYPQKSGQTLRPRMFGCRGTHSLPRRQRMTTMATPGQRTRPPWGLVILLFIAMWISPGAHGPGLRPHLHHRGCFLLPCRARRGSHPRDPDQVPSPGPGGMPRAGAGWRCTTGSSGALPDGWHYTFARKGMVAVTGMQSHDVRDGIEHVAVQEIAYCGCLVHITCRRSSLLRRCPLLESRC
jgi:hypothetical protein